MSEKRWHKMPDEAIECFRERDRELAKSIPEGLALDNVRLQKELSAARDQLAEMGT